MFVIKCSLYFLHSQARVVPLLRKVYLWYFWTWRCHLNGFSNCLLMLYNIPFIQFFYWPSGYGVIWISKWVVRNFQHKKAPKFRYLAVRFKKLAVSLVDLFEHVFNSNVGVNMDSESSEHVEKAANCEIFCKMSFHALYWTGSNLKPSHTNLTARFAAKTTFFQQAIKGVE